MQEQKDDRLWWLDDACSIYSIIDEHRAVREGAGIFDVSHMGEILIEGRDAKTFSKYT